MLKVPLPIGRSSLCLFVAAGFALAGCGDDEGEIPTCPAGTVYSAAQDACVPVDPGPTDADNDGVAAADDCDDADPDLGARAADADCDGVLTASDCDDSDAMIGSNANDMDCDGVATADDCDDDDAMAGSMSMDMDCDGVLTADDCNDDDAMAGSMSMDMDCDGVLTADDCNDSDPMIGSRAGDMDCDGIPTADDCDDDDAMAGAVALDTDCDGVLNADDECPTDPMLSVSPAPEVRVRFPNEISATNATSLTVSGSVTLFCDNTIDSATAGVGGSVMTLQLDAVSASEFTWSFETSLAEEQVTPVLIEATDSRSRSGAASVNVVQYREPEAPPAETLGSSQGIALDPVNNVAYVSDEALPGVYAIELTTGNSRIFSGGTVGTGVAFDADLEGGIAYDGVNNRLLVTDDGADAIIAVDLTTGNRSVLSDNTNTGPALGTLYGIAVDATGNRAFVVDSTFDGVIAIDLANGNRTPISSDGVRGTGPALTTPRDVAVDLANNRLLVVGTGLDALVAVDLATGDRTIVSDATRGTGVPFSSIRGVTLDAANGRALVAEAGNGFEGVVAVDLATGDRIEISGPNVGTTLDAGADFDSTRGIIIDAANNRLIAVDDEVTALVSVALPSGDRTLIVPQVPAPPAVGSGPVIVDPTGIAIDPTANALYVADDGTNSVVAVSLADGSRTTIADMSSPGVVLDEPRGLGFDAANRRLLVPDNASSLDAVIGIDLTTGMGTIISGDDSPDEMSETFASPRGRVAVEPSGMTALVADTARDSLFRINLTTGERTTLAEAGDAELEGIQTVAIDADGGRAIVTAASSADGGTLDAVLAIDLATGAITQLASTATVTPVGSGPLMTNPRGLDLDLANDRAVVFDADQDALISVDLISLARTVISSSEVGNGDLLGVVANDTNAIELDPSRGVVFAVSEGSGQVMMIDLTSGDQVVISR